MSKRDRYFADVAAIRATGTSADGSVTVTRDPDGDLDVDIRPGLPSTRVVEEPSQFHRATHPPAEPAAPALPSTPEESVPAPGLEHADETPKAGRAAPIEVRLWSSSRMKD